jgi:hypothetical protein
MENKFVNKQNLSNLNNQLSRQLNLSDKSNSEKKDMLIILLSNMRKVYNKLDKSKISERHLPKILDTFNKYALNETIKEISSKTQINKRNNLENLSHKRGQEINSNNKIHYLERPSNINQRKNISFDINKRNYDLMNNMDQTSRYNNNIAPEKAMENLIKERSNDIKEPKRPPTPDFLKSKSVRKTVEPFDNSSSVNEEKNNLNMLGDTYYLTGVNLDNNFSNINFQNNEISQNLPDVDESVDTNKRLEILQDERSKLNNFSNSDEVIKPNFSKSIEENKELLNQQQQYQRQQYEQQQYEQQQYEQQQYQRQQYEQQQYQRQQYEQQQYQRQQYEQQQYEQQQQQYQQQQYQQQKYQQQNQKHNFNESQINNNLLGNLENIKKDDLLKLLNTYAKNSSQNVEQFQENIETNETINKFEKKENQMSEYLSELTKKQLEQLRQVQDLQEQLQSHIKNQMLNPNTGNSQGQVVNNMSSSDDQLKNELVSKVKILTGQLEQEKKINIELRNKLDEEIQTKNNDNEKKLHLIEVKKEEIRSEVNNLSNKHKDIERSYQTLLRKEKFLASLIEKNMKVLQTDKETILVDSKIHNFESKFIYVFDKKLIDVSRIELLSYDFPLTSNNINETNNKLYFKFDKNKIENSEKDLLNNSSDSEEVAIDVNEDYNIITIPEGNYDISSLVKKLNKLGSGFKLIFSYNKNTNKVTIKSESIFSLFKKENNILNLLGFESEIFENHINYQGSKPYDLRKYNYVYINLLNVSNKTFASVNINNFKKGSYYLDTDYIELDKLEIEVKDEFDNLMNFCNLPFKLEFNFIFSNKNINIDDNENLIDSDNSLENKNISSPDISNIILN